MGIAERRERDKRRRRHEIIDAAEEVFFSKGIDAATMDDVANAAELSKGTLYLYFPSKEDLYHAIALRGMEIMHGRFKDMVEQGGTGLEQIQRIGTVYFEFYKTYPNYFEAVLFHEHAEIDVEEADPTALMCLQEGLNVHQLMAQVIQTGMEDGSLRADLDPVKTSLMLWGTATGVIQIINTRNDLLGQMGMDSNSLYEYYIQTMWTALEKNSLPV